MARISWHIIALVVAAGAACHKDSTGPADHIAGAYKLAAVNQSALPDTLTFDGQPRVVRSGTLDVNDATYHFTICVDAFGTATGVCGAGKLAIVDSGFVWTSTGGGVSFVGMTSYISRALVVTGDSLTFQRGDLLTPTLTFVR